MRWSEAGYLSRIVLAHAPRQASVSLILGVSQKMSLADLDRSRTTVISFTGRRCFCTIVTNSLKLHIDEDKKDGSYIWIDPPWVFSRGFEEVASADSCPHYSESDYEPRFRDWCVRLRPLSATTLERVEEHEDGGITLHFSDDYRIFIPLDESVCDDERMWYDHWYARLEEKG